MSKNEFSTLSSINTDDKKTWQEKIFITIDIDWAKDEILEDTMNLLYKLNVAATWFITHKTDLLIDIKANPLWEIGIHPNFNNLLNGNVKQEINAEKEIDRLINIEPNAKSVRSHSTTQSGHLINLFGKKGLTHDANHFIPSGSGIKLKPWLMWNGLTRVPYCWEDDIYIYYEGTKQPELSISQVNDKSNKDLKVFDFHPIHIYLNTEEMERYEKTRDIHTDPFELKKYRHNGIGTRSRFIELINTI